MRITLIFVFLNIFHSLFSQNFEIEQPVRFLAIGDSYTIGSNVEPNESWPFQFVDYLEKNQYSVDGFLVIAKSGWTTFNIKNAVLSENPSNIYNMVSLLAGANNVFFNTGIEVYKTEFEDLLNHAIEIAGSEEKVFVISIPDYAYTPAYSNNRESTSLMIKNYNAANRLISDSKNISYVDITFLSRLMLNNPAYVSSDGLHPSAAMYALWVDLITQTLLNESLNSREFTEPENLIEINSYVYDKVLFIEMPDYLKNNKPRLSVISTSGRIIYEGPFKDELNLQNMSSGFYLYQIITNENRYFSGKIFI